MCVASGRSNRCSEAYVTIGQHKRRLMTGASKSSSSRRFLKWKVPPRIFHYKPTILGYSHLWNPRIWFFLLVFSAVAIFIVNQAPVRSSCELHVLTRRSSPVVISAFGSSVRYLQDRAKLRSTETRPDSTTVQYYGTNLSGPLLLQGKYKQW